MKMNKFDVVCWCNEVIHSPNYGRLIKLAAERFINNYNSDNYYYDSAKVERCIAFFGLFKHFLGTHAGKQFVLCDWQKFIIANIVGIYHAKSKTRKYISSYIQIARKQGKTAFAAVLCLYYLIADGEECPEIILAANSVEQGKIAFNYAYEFVNQLGKTQFNKYRNSIEYSKNKGVLKVISTNAKTGDGGNTSFALVDEFHSAPTSLLKDVIQSSMGMRENPHLMVVTTAGFDKTLPCYDLRQSSVDILLKIKDNPSHFALIFEMDEGDNWRDKKNWIKSNPNLGVTVKESWLKQQINQAIINPSDEMGVRTKNLNEWLSSSNTWISDKYILDSFMESEEMDKIFSEKRPLFAACDLSACSDLTCCSFLTVKDGIFYFRTEYFLPEENANNSKLHEKIFKEWKPNNYINIIPGNVTDYDFILDYIKKYEREHYRIKRLHYDRWNATQFAINATKEGLRMHPMAQTVTSYNTPTKELERLILSGKVRIERNTLTLFCFRNVLLYCDHIGNVRPIKTLNSNKIDGVITMIMALSAYLEEPQYSNSL